MLDQHELVGLINHLAARLDRAGDARSFIHDFGVGMMQLIAAQDRMTPRAPEAQIFDGSGDTFHVEIGNIVSER